MKFLFGLYAFIFLFSLNSDIYASTEIQNKGNLQEKIKTFSITNKQTNKQTNNKKLNKRKTITDKKRKSLLFKYGWKDSMFSYNHGTWKDEKHDFLWVDYQQKRDLEDRDFIDVEQAFPEWVDLSLKDKEKSEYFTSSKGKKLQYYSISGGNKFLIIFIHGLNGNSTWGFKDWTFNGNFNRLKHLAYYNKGTYISTNITNFHIGASEMGDLISTYKQKNPKMKIIMACGSSGGETCWKVYNNTTIPLDGMLMLGSIAPYSQSYIEKRKIPIYYGHGGKDRQISYMSSVRAVENIKKNGNPVKLEIFTNGVHGTPLRMIDWLHVLKWMFGEEKYISLDKGKNAKPAQEKPVRVNEVFPK